jgi:hypothetical protein
MLFSLIQVNFSPKFCQNHFDPNDANDNIYLDFHIL